MTRQGDALRALRVLARLRQQDVGNILSLSRQRIEQFESGSRIPRHHAMRLVHFFSVEDGELRQTLLGEDGSG